MPVPVPKSITCCADRNLAVEIAHLAAGIAEISRRRSDLAAEIAYLAAEIAPPRMSSTRRRGTIRMVRASCDNNSVGATTATAAAAATTTTAAHSSLKRCVATSHSAGVRQMTPRLFSSALGELSGRDESGSSARLEMRASWSARVKPPTTRMYKVMTGDDGGEPIENGWGRRDPAARSWT